MLFIEILNQMYRKAGVLKHAGQGLNGSQQEEGLHICNSLLDGLKIERLFFYQIIRTVFDTVQNQPSYRVGALVDGAEWVIERPEKILRAGYLIPNGSSAPSELPMQVLLDYTQYQLIVNKGVTSSLSWVMYYRASLPTGTATLWPVPNQVFQVTLYTPGYVDEFTDIMATLEIPKGYRQFLEYAGAVEVHNNYPSAVMSPMVPAQAALYKSRIKAAQFAPDFIESDPAARVNPVTRGRWWGAREFPGGY